MSALTAALDAYRDAVASRARQESRGTYGDGRMILARDAERAARAAVLTAARFTGETDTTEGQ